jgi:hypothetical protein
MAQNEAPPVLDPKREQLIFALMREKTKAAAARAAGIEQRTMYRWLADPEFKEALRAARRAVFDDALFVLEKGAVKAAQALVDALELLDVENQPFVLIMAATRVLDRAFKAQDSIAVEEELAKLRAVVDAVKAGQTPTTTVAATPATGARMMTDEELAEASRIRLVWMIEVGNDPADAEASLRHNPPQSVLEEQHLLDLVRSMLAAEREYPS